jgi:hypothetical protein
VRAEEFLDLRGVAAILIGRGEQILLPGHILLRPDIGEEEGQQFRVAINA